MADARREVEAVFRIESARLIAGLTRFVRDVGLAEELAQDALVAALEKWPAEGIPQNPGAWLMTTAKNRAIDQSRRARKFEESKGELWQPEHSMPDVEDEIGDDLLRLMLIACHPVLPTDARTALTLRLLGGLTIPEIARAFLTPETTIQQRIVRAKRTLAEKRAAFEVPDVHERLGSVLEVVYLIFNEGYSATGGDDWVRPELCQDALRLGRILQGLAPDEPEVHGLAALMEIQASRLHARVSASGEPVLLLDQDRARWDQLLIRRGLHALERAGDANGPYVLQARIAACHARARTAAETDWALIARLYGELFELSPSPIVELNRAVAVSMAEGPAAGLAIVDELAEELPGYHLLPSVRGDLLFKLGRLAEARAEFEKAAALTRNARERALLLERARACGTLGE